MSYSRNINGYMHRDDEPLLDNKPRICECCGAPLHGYVCEYCGVDYGALSDEIRKEKEKLLEQMLNSSISAQQAFILSGLPIDV